VCPMTMGLKVRRVLDEEVKDKAKKRKKQSDDVMDTVYSRLVAAFKSQPDDPDHPYRQKKKKKKKKPPEEKDVDDWDG